MLIFEKVAGKKPAILLKYERFTDVLQRLKLDNKKTFLSEQLLLTVSVYQEEQKMDWKFFYF